MKRILTATFSALILMAAVLGPFSVASADSGVPLTVTIAGLNVRGGPGTNYPVLNVIHLGDTAQAMGRNADTSWYQVQLSDGTMGWLSAAFVQPGGDTGALTVVAAPAVPASTSTGGGAAAVRSGASTLVFQTSSGGAIYAVSLDSGGNPISAPRFLTNGIDPALSPDGTMVAFTRWDGGSGNGALGSLWVINLDGSGERKLLGFVAQPKSPTWSPDGATIAINMQQGGSIDIQHVTMALGCGQRPSIPPGAQDISFTAPECNGNTTVTPGSISYTVPANPHWGLRTVSVANGSFQDQPRSTHSFAPTWDPTNANRIVFAGDSGLINVDLAGQTTTALTANIDQRAPLFSPDGTKIAVSYHQDSHWEVHVLNADGSGDTRLTETPLTAIVDQEIKGQTAVQWNNTSPAWSPDGSQIAFLTDRSGTWEIWAMNADGSNQHALLGAAALNGLTFRYDGNDERMLSWR